jgi:hypothetical protein
MSRHPQKIDPNTPWSLYATVLLPRAGKPTSTIKTLLRDDDDDDDDKSILKKYFFKILPMSNYCRNHTI